MTWSFLAIKFVQIGSIFCFNEIITNWCVEYDVFIVKNFEDYVVLMWDLLTDRAWFHLYWRIYQCVWSGYLRCYITVIVLYIWLSTMRVCTTWTVCSTSLKILCVSELFSSFIFSAVNWFRLVFICAIQNDYIVVLLRVFNL